MEDLFSACDADSSDEEDTGKKRKLIKRKKELRSDSEGDDEESSESDSDDEACELGIFQGEWNDVLHTHAQKIYWLIPKCVCNMYIQACIHTILYMSIYFCSILVHMHA